MKNPIKVVRVMFGLFSVLLTVLLLTALYAPASLAHSVVVWAEPVGDRIQVEAFLSNGAPVKRGEVLVLDHTGKELGRGKLDDAGRFRFAKPAVPAVRLKVILSRGHEGVFDLDLTQAE